MRGTTWTPKKLVYTTRHLQLPTANQNFCKDLSRPLEDRAVIDERTRARIREELNTTNRRIPSDSLFVNDEDDDISDDGEDYDDDLVSLSISAHNLYHYLC